MLNVENILAALVLLGFAYVIFKGGAAMPVGTFSLQNRLGKVEGELKKLKLQVSGAASADQVKALTETVEQLEKHTASSGEVIAIAGQIDALRAEFGGTCNGLDIKIDGVKAASDRTEAGVRRIEGYFLQRGIDGK